MAITERNEPRQGADGKWVMWRVIESDAEGAGGAYPLGEVTLSGAASALSQLYSQRESLAVQLADVDAQITSMEAVKTAIYQGATA